MDASESSSVGANFSRRIVDVTDKKITPTQQIISSCCGALTTSLVVTPFDVVKVRVQKQLTSGCSSAVRSIQKGHCSSHKCRTYVTPLDVVKVRMQSQLRPMRVGTCFVCSNGLMDHVFTCVRHSGTLPTPSNCMSLPWYARPAPGNGTQHFSGTIDALYKIARYEGLGSLWSGLSPTLLMALPATVGYFYIYDNLRSELRQRWGDSLMGPMVAGSTTRVIMVTLINPFEMVRTKLQSEQMTYKEVLSAVRVTARRSGWRTLWQGWVPTLYRDVPFSAIYWGGYETMKNYLLRISDMHDTNFGISFLCGAVSGSVGIAAVLTLPFDVVKTSRQISIGEHRSTPAQSTWSTIQSIHAKDGFRGLFAGFTPRIARVAPSCAIMIASYEYGKIFFSDYNKLHADMT